MSVFWFPAMRHDCRGCRCWLLIFFLLLLFPADRVWASTPDAGCRRLLAKIYSNLAATGEIIAVLPENREVLIEYPAEMIPAYDAELLAFPELDEGGGPTPGLLRVSEVAGHLNRALIEEGSAADFKVGDRVGLPRPILMYLTPVANLTPYPGLTNQFTAALAAQLPRLEGVRIFSLAGSNQETVAFLQQQCRRQGLYGILLQPFVSLVNGRVRLELRPTSLYSAQRLGIFTDDLRPFQPAGASPVRP